MADKASAKINAFFKHHKAAAWGIIIAGGAGAILLWRHNAAKQATAATAGGKQIDPKTGYVAGSAQDEQALANGGYYGTGYNPHGGGYNPFPVRTGGGGGSTGGSTGRTVTNNDEWFMHAKNVLPNGHSRSVEEALSRVLGGLTVTWMQRALFLEAVGILGPPPNGYPKPIKVEHGGGDHGGSHGKVEVPNVIGDEYAEALRDITARGLTMSMEGAGPIKHQEPHPGAEVRRGTVVNVIGGFK